MLTSIDVKFIFDSARLDNIFIGSLIAKFFQIWSSVTGYGEVCVCFLANQNRGNMLNK